MYGLSLYSAPAIEPLTVAEARYQCGIADSYHAHDQAFDALITAARCFVENWTGRAIINQTWDFTFDTWPWECGIIRLPKSPVSSVSFIKYYDGEGTQQTWSSSNYMVSIDREPATIRLAYQATWPYHRYQPDALTIRFVAGYGAAASSVPQPIKQAMLLLVSHWFEQRNPIGQLTEQVAFTLTALLDQYRVGDEFVQYAESM